MMAEFSPLTGNIQSMQYFDPQALAQLQSDQMQLEQKQRLAQALMGGNYVPNSGRAGALTSILGSVVGAFQQRQNNEKVTDILKRQFEAQNQAAQAKHKQDMEDEQRKLMQEVFKARASEQAKKEFAPAQFQASGMFDPSTGTYTPSSAAAQQEIGIKSAEAEAAARASAKYREAPGAAGNAKMAQIAALMKQPDSPTKTAQLTSLLGEGGMQALAFNSMGAGGGIAQGPSGEEFLKGLNPSMAGQVKAIAEGRQAPPNGMAMRSPMGQALLAAVTQYDPTFDATNYAARSKARNAFTAGKEGQTLNALNTAIGHAGELYDVAGKLNNSSIPGYNTAANWLSTQTGDPRVTAYNQTRDALVGELTKAFRGSSGNKADIEEATANLSAAASPAQQKAAIGQAMKLLSSKATSLSDQYTQAFGANSKPNFLDPHAQAALQKLSAAGIDTGFDMPEGTDIGPQIQAAKAQGISEQPTQTATNPKTGQKIGLVNGQWVPL